MNGLDRLADVGVEVMERLRRPRRLDARLGVQRPLEVVVVEGEHAAVGVVDEDHLARVHQALRDGERADLVLGHDATGVADHVGLAVAEAERSEHVEP
jgi:Zn-dependent alcohol dehydrogenase